MLDQTVIPVLFQLFVGPLLQEFEVELIHILATVFIAAKGCHPKFLLSPPYGSVGKEGQHGWVAVV